MFRERVHQVDSVSELKLDVSESGSFLSYCISYLVIWQFDSKVMLGLPPTIHVVWYINIQVFKN